jgi:hypothetical protein
VKILGTAEVRADWNIINGGRILVDGTNNTEELRAGVLEVTNASIKTEAQSPGLPLWVRNHGNLSVRSDVDANNNPTGSIELPVVVDGGTLTSRSFALQAGLLQRGQSTTTISGEHNLINGKAPTNEGPTSNLHTESVYIAGGALLVISRARLATDGDIIIKPTAILSASGTIQTGTKQECFVVVEGTLRLSPPGTPTEDASTKTLNIRGSLSLGATSTTRIRVLDNASDDILATKAISLGGNLEVVNENNIQNQSWTILVAGIDLKPDPNAPPPLKLIGEFTSVSNGFTTVKRPRPGPSDTLKLKTGNG